MVSIRPATPADLDVVLALRLALLQEAHDHPVYGRLRTDAERRARRLFRHQLESSAQVTLLAEADGAAVGVLRCVEAPSSPLLEPERYAYVSAVYVVPSARRSGVLRAMLQHAAAWCRARRLEEMRLHSVAGRTVANAAWDALGFAVVEHLRVRPVRTSSTLTVHRAAPRPPAAAASAPRLARRRPTPREPTSPKVRPAQRPTAVER